MTTGIRGQKAVFGRRNTEIRCDSRKVGRWECQERHKENKLDVLTSCGKKAENDVNGSSGKPVHNVTSSRLKQSLYTNVTSSQLKQPSRQCIGFEALRTRKPPTYQPANVPTKHLVCYFWCLISTIGGGGCRKIQG